MTIIELVDLPSEILCQIFCNLSPRDLASLTQTSKILSELIGEDGHIWRVLSSKLWDDAHLDRPLLYYNDKGQEIWKVRDQVNWKKVVQERVNLENIMISEDEKLRLSNFTASTQILLSIAANAQTTDFTDPLSPPTPSFNANWLNRMTTIEQIKEFYFHRDFVRGKPLRNGRIYSIDDQTDIIEGNLLSRLHLTFGLFEPVVVSATHPQETCLWRTSRGRAREIVYDLNNFDSHNRYGPFLKDGSGKVDWKLLEAISVVMGRNVREAIPEWISGELLEGEGQEEDELNGNHSELVPARTGRFFPPKNFSTSLPFPAVPWNLKPSEDENEILDWARIGLEQRGTYAFWTIGDDLYHYNFHGMHMGGPRPSLDAHMEGVGDIMTLKLKISPRFDTLPRFPESSDPLRPTLYFKGTSEGVMNGVNRVRGAVRVTPDGHIAWSYIISYDGADRWALEGVQLGQANCIVGQWSDAFHEAESPLGPWVYWQRT